MDPGTIFEIIKIIIEAYKYREVVTGKRWFRGKPVNNLIKWIDPRKRDINIDIYSYTGETMYAPIYTVLQEKMPSSKTVKIRILLRNCNYPFLLRDYAVNPDYKLYDEVITKKVYNGIQNWKEGLERLSDNIKIEIKAYKFEPSFKAVMIDGCRGYFGFYRIDPRHVKSIQGRDISAPDYVAADTSLVPLDNPRIGSGRILLDSFKSWFERTWDNFSEPLCIAGCSS